LAGSSLRIRKYVEGLKREPSADIGPKDIFAITSNLLSPTPQRPDRIRRSQATRAGTRGCGSRFTDQLFLTKKVFSLRCTSRQTEDFLCGANQMEHA